MAEAFPYFYEMLIGKKGLDVADGKGGVSSLSHRRLPPGDRETVGTYGPSRGDRPRQCP